MVDLCTVVLILYIVTVVLYAICKARESVTEKSVWAKITCFLRDAILCPIMLLLKALSSNKANDT
jgi:hypothetical protein